MAGTLASITEPVQRGFRWWTSELAGLVPAALVQREPPYRPGVVVLVEAAGLRLLDERTKRRATTPLDGALNSALDTFDELLQLAQEQPAVTVRLRLPHAQCFSRHVDLPDAARGDVGRILQLDMERATPFRSKDVYTAHVIETGQVTRGVLRVRHFIVPREAVDKALADVRETGVTVTCVECWNADGSRPLPVNFLATESEGYPATPRSMKMLIVASVLLAASAAYTVTTQHDRALAELVQTVAGSRIRADAVRNSVRASEQQLEDITSLKSMKGARTATVTVLDNLTRLLPDTAWLTDFKLDDDTVDISGFAKSAAALVPLLETSNIFSEATFTAAVTRDPSEDKERFSLRVRVSKLNSEHTPQNSRAVLP